MLLLLAPFALAAWPEDVSLLAMADYAGSATATGSTDDYVAAGYHQVVRELGMSLTTRPLVPGETLGINGFAVNAGTTLSFIRTGTIDGQNPSGWDLADPDEDPPIVLFLPWVNVQKGLPLSIEVGATFGWIAESRTGFLGVDGRWGLVEGYRQFPDLSVQVGYNGYIGNDELELGVLDFGAVLGYTLPFGVTQGIHQAQFSPFVGAGIAQIHAAPRVDLSDSGIGDSIAEVSGAKGQPGFDKQFAPFQVSGGFRILNGDYSFTLSAAYSPNILPTVNAGLGFVY